MNRRGFSLIELVIAIVLVGLMASFFFPRIGQEIQKQNVRSARAAMTTMMARARASAIQRGLSVSLVHRSNRVFMLSTHPVTRAVDTISQQNLYDSYGVTITASPRDSVVFDSRGIGGQASSTYFYISKAGFADTIEVSSVGGIIR